MSRHLQPPPSATPRRHSGRAALVLLGPPGVGKGTQGRLLAEEYGVSLVSTGDLLRAAVNDATPLGERAASSMRAGKLVPSHLIDDMVATRVAAADARDGFVLDGYPRTVAQARALTGVLHRLEQALTAAVLFEATDEEVVRRLSGRRSCAACGRTYHTVLAPPRRADHCDADQHPLARRDDDHPDTIRNRLDVYRRDTEPVAEYYRQRGVLVSVDAAQGPHEVQASLRAALASKALESRWG